MEVAGQEVQEWRYYQNAVGAVAVSHLRCAVPRVTARDCQHVEYTEETPMHRITHRDGGSHRSKETRQGSIYAALLATRFATTWPRLVPFIVQMCMESTCHAGIAIAAVDAVQ